MVRTWAWQDMHPSLRMNSMQIGAHMMHAEHVLLVVQQLRLLRRHDEAAGSLCAERAELATGSEAQRQPVQLAGRCSGLCEVQVTEAEAQQRVHSLRIGSWSQPGAILVAPYADRQLHVRQGSKLMSVLQRLDLRQAAGARPDWTMRQVSQAAAAHKQQATNMSEDTARQQLKHTYSLMACIQISQPLDSVSTGP